FVVACLWSAIYQVDHGYRGVKVTLGKVEKVSLVNGVGVKWPFISDVIQMNVQTQAFTDSTSSYTSDVQTAGLRYTFTYDLNPDNVHVLYESVGEGYIRKKVTPVLNDVLKDVIGRWQAQDLVANRDKAREQILTLLNKRIDKNYFRNLTFQIISLDYSDKFETAIEDKVIADQRAQEAVNNTKRIKEEAEQKVISAKADAEAMEIKTRALAAQKGLTEYEAVQKWDGKLPQYMMGGSVPFINLPSGK
ncbi:MAG: prohibitin family protein, partial [Alphaproteobacteria bacterium]|nr:prohibitin family protein [Alphaproteobacteria bacterium]